MSLRRAKSGRRFGSGSAHNFLPRYIRFPDIFVHDYSVRRQSLIVISYLGTYIGRYCMANYALVVNELVSTSVNKGMPISE